MRPDIPVSQIKPIKEAAERCERERTFSRDVLANAGLVMPGNWLELKEWGVETNGEFHLFPVSPVLTFSPDFDQETRLYPTNISQGKALILPSAGMTGTTHAQMRGGD